MSFQIHALPREQFSELFAMSDEELLARRAVRVRVEQKPGTPCRVSLVDAEVGESVILVNYCHQPSENPYHANHAIFVREGVEQARPVTDEVPEVLASRLISLRCFDQDDMLIDADVVAGKNLANSLKKAFRDDHVAYIDLHNAKPGCYAARVTRA